MIKTENFTIGATRQANDPVIVAAGLNIHINVLGSKIPNWDHVVEFYGYTKRDAEQLRDHFFDRAKAFDKIAAAYDAYFVDKDKGASDRLLMSVVAAVREIKRVE